MFMASCTFPDVSILFYSNGLVVYLFITNPMWPLNPSTICVPVPRGDPTSHVDKWRLQLSAHAHKIGPSWSEKIKQLTHLILLKPSISRVVSIVRSPPCIFWHLNWSIFIDLFAPGPARTAKIIKEMSDRMKRIEDKFGHLMEINGVI